MNKPHWIMLFAAAVTLAAVLCVGCASAPTVTPAGPPAAPQVIAALVLMTCGTPTAVEVITSDGSVYFMLQSSANPDAWGEALKQVVGSGSKAAAMELAPDCTKA